MKQVKLAGRQQGVVLVVALIMLLLVMLMVVSGFNMTQTNLKVVQNMESRNLAKQVANAAIEEVISSPDFMSNPNAVFAVACDQPNQKCIDINGDGARDLEVSMAAPRCIVVQPIKNAELDLTNPSDASCFVAGEESLCVNSVWELRATARDVLTEAEFTVRQGVAVRATKNNIATACPD
jgi:Tfp pilus assembly protein PilV